MWPKTEKWMKNKIEELELDLLTEKKLGGVALNILNDVRNILENVRSNRRDVIPLRALSNMNAFQNLPDHARNLMGECQRLGSRVQDMEGENRRLQKVIEAIRAEAEREKMLLKEKHAREESALQDRIRNLEGANNDLSDQLGSLRIDHDKEKKALNTSHQKEKARIEAYHRQEKEKLRKDRDALSAGLLSRDDFKPTPDIEMITKFQKVSQEVENLARIEWRKDQELWANEMLSHLSLNPRLLKKQILQDSIWTILHQYVFCSPFRAFGVEGKSLEKQWNQQCGEDPQMMNEHYTWPKPEVETERWRYVNIKECSSALRLPAPSEWDPRALLKKGFVKHIEEARKKLIVTLENVVDLDERGNQAVSKIVREAASMWFELGVQRCRIMIIMQDSSPGTPREKILQAQKSHINLLTLPELRRCGNSKGIDLEMQEVMGGCRHEVIHLDPPEAPRLQNKSSR